MGAKGTGMQAGVPTGHRKCYRCKEVKSVLEFRHTYRCLGCDRDYYREYHQRASSKIRAKANRALRKEASK